MKTVQEILNRIRWDEDFAKNTFKIAYYDRLEKDLILVDFHELHFPADDHFSFQLVDQDGETHSIPYHRVKAIYENDQLIWQRKF
ncbi:MAG: hypothetical protein AMJ53_17180 [Gammaproteobacteria bacterium SG8_11]|nr:MAG: hypothetical protein AMJ53_17180 [Gammaproteobacteria bacterium SG8_11]